ncbi:FliO/MopB family protein [Salinibacter grassmerensis]|uniref:FliO/MopB family protein n=1 Tax=Salinibacter grassmerensis TaxID=3040353 RepID=UPI0021E98A10|nr:flagellar biosynthetic protein FliO [Salinibacter grassmerensis]
MVPSAPDSPGVSTRRLAWYALYALGALVALWVLVQAAALVPPAEGAESADGAEREAPASPSVSSDAGVDLFTWGNLSALLVLVGGGGYALYVRRRVSSEEGSVALRPIGQLALGQSQHLRLVACGDEVLLVGATEETVELLKTYPREAFDESILDAAEGDEAPPGGSGPSPQSAHFADVLKQFARQNSLS